MQAINKLFRRIIEGTHQFLVPVFQRDYSWTDEHCEQFLHDVVEAGSQPLNRPHFLGSIVYIASDEASASFTRWLLIDGQQRVTTLLLLVAALRDHLRDSGWQGGKDSPTVGRLQAAFLHNEHEEGERRPKLMLRGDDQAMLRAVLEGDESPRSGSDRVRENYEWFRDALNDLDPDLVYRGINQLVVVDVVLDRGVDDPQLVFESLNSTGLELSQSDLIRNFVLMGLIEPEQDRLYTKYWRKIERLFRGSEQVFDSFVRDYLALESKASRQEKAGEVYFAFRRRFGDSLGNVDELEDILAQLLQFARYYAAFCIQSSDVAPVPLREPLTDLHLHADVPAILVMRLYECFDAHGTLGEAEFVEALRLIESYLLRRSVCGLQTRSYWQVFAGLAHTVDRDQPLVALKVGLARRRGSYRFPDDREFREALLELEHYKKRYCFNLLAKLENAGSREKSDTSMFTVEHVMPQSERLGREWREMLGPEWREVQREWLHRLGNLTLTGYNSKYSDRPFEEKKQIPDGFRDSAVRLNRYIREQSQWTPKEIEERGRRLAERALEVWGPLRVDRDLIRRAEIDEKKRRAAQVSVDQVPMSDRARELFARLSQSVQEVDDGIFAIAELKSVSYHGPNFFLEVIPRKRRLTLLLDIAFSEIDDPRGIAKDASQRTVFRNASYEGGVNIPIHEEEQIEMAMPIIRHAHARSLED